MEQADVYFAVKKNTIWTGYLSSLVADLLLEGETSKGYFLKGTSDSVEPHDATKSIQLSYSLEETLLPSYKGWARFYSTRVCSRITQK